MTSIYAKIFSNDERSGDRFGLSIDTLMRELGEADHPIHIVNISQAGFAGRSTHRFSIPSIVSIALPGVGDVKARVSWVGDGEFGCEFLASISLETLAASLKD